MLPYKDTVVYMSVWALIMTHIKKNATKIVAPVAVLLFVGLVVVYDISLPTAGNKNQNIVIDCAKASINDPLYSLQCEDDTSLDLSFESAVERFATTRIYDSDLGYIMPTQDDMNDELITAHGSTLLVGEGSLLDFSAEERLYLHHPSNSASWRNVWLAEDKTVYTLDAYMVVSANAAGKLHNILTKELDGVGTLLVSVDTSFRETFAVQGSYTSLLGLGSGLCVIVTLVQKNNIVVSAVSRETKDCESLDYRAHIYLTSLVIARAGMLTPVK